jgi:hypothetical protein
VRNAVTPSTTDRTPIALAAIGVVVFGLAALASGQSNNWDLSNYHWYDGWAWLTGRGDADLAAAQLQTFFNPLLPAALYALLSSLPPALGTFALGAVQGLNLPLIYLVAHALLPGRSRTLVVAAACVGAIGATQLGELGATFGDNLVSLPLLGALALAVGPIDRRRALAAGLLVGAAVGVKLTVAPFAAGIVLALPLVARDRREAFVLFVAASFAALAGFLATGGFWMLELTQRFGNPLFPMFADGFGGDYVPPADLRDRRFLPRDAVQWLFYPLAWADTPRAVSEQWFLDLRVPLAFLAALALPAWWRRAASRQLALVLAALGIGYAGWLVLFGYYRYLAIVEMLAPALVAAALTSLPFSRRATLVATSVVLVLVTVTTRPPKWGRLPHYGERYVEVSVPDLPDLAKATVLLVDDAALAFMIPSFPATTRFVRLGGNFMGPPLEPWGMDREAARRITATTGPLYALAGNDDATRADAALARHGLVREANACRPVTANLLHRRPPATICPVRPATLAHRDASVFLPPAMRPRP